MKNINIWLSYGSKLAHMLLLSHFWANWVEIFLGGQETIIYGLVMSNQDYEASKPNQKVRPLGESFGTAVISKMRFQNFRA